MDVQSLSTDLEIRNIQDGERINRKNKPPNLQLNNLILHNAPGVNDDASNHTASFDSVTSSEDSPPLVTLRTKIIKSIDVGTINSPLIKRSSRLEEILEIPDVAAALVHDKGYDMLIARRRGSYDSHVSQPLRMRQQTPGHKKSEEQEFSFEESIEEEGDLSSDSSLVIVPEDTLSSHPDVDSSEKRPHLTTIKKTPDKSENVLELISNNITPATIFGSPILKEASPDHSEAIPVSPGGKANKKRIKNKKGEYEVNENNDLTPTKKTFLSKFRITPHASKDQIVLQGWSSLGRALARVGVMHAALASDLSEIELNPVLTPILKRRTPNPRWSGENIIKLKTDPGMKSTLKKKNVSFSRLPSEACVKNSADCVKAMQEGHQFVKMRSNSRVYNRVYWLEGKENCLRWEPSKKDAGKAKIDITNIREVRPGKSTELFLSSDISTHFPDECSFSIIYGEGKTLDLIANSADDANVWVTGLRCLMTGQDIEGLKMRTDARDLWLSSMFDGADINKDGFLDEDESIELLTTLSDGIRELSIKQKLQEYFQLNATVGARLKKEEFVEIFKDVATRPEIYFLLVKYASRGDQLSTDDLMLFLESEQGVQQATLKQCIQIINDHEPSETIRNIPAIGIDGFTKYLMSEECSIFNPAHSQVCQDMTQPLSHYFIASSHNTYIMEDQVSGPSSVSAYVRALLRCCRCVELDCWDGPEGIPQVTHGHTLTNKVPFVQVIEAISESSFRNSVYPVILCLENHCSLDQQIKMAQILKEILGDRIYVEGSNDIDILPSPEDLKRKFIIRSRKLPQECDDEQGYVSAEDEGKEVENQSPMYNNEEITRVNVPDQQQIALSKQLSSLVSLSAKKRLQEQFSSNEQKNSCDQTCSIHELEATSFVENIPEQFVSHNKKFLTRVYPSGARIDSSNFNPQDFWNCGVQIASLNYQTPGLMMDINDGRFSMNGGCGYVLKPLVMRDKIAYYNTQPSDSIPGVSPKLLHLRIISGQNFPKPRGGGAKGQVIDPYVLIELFGVPGDCAELRTRTAPNNSGGSPIFDESFDFRLSLPSLALVRFVVLDDEFIGDEFIGQYTIPFECLQPGYRHLRLRSIFDEPLEDATLFVHVTVSEPDSIVMFSGSAAAQSSATAPVKLTKRNSGQKKLRKTRSRKDLELINVRDVMVAKADELFRSALDDIRAAASLRDSHRSALTMFREACGLTPQSSVKQCVRALWKRARNETGGSDNASGHQKKTRKLSTPAMDSDPANVDEVRRRAQSADAVTARLRRQPSETSQSSNDSSVTSQLPRVSLVKRDRRLTLELRGQCATNDTWRKTSLMLESLSSESLAVLDQTESVCERLSEFHDKARTLYEELPSLLSAPSSASTESSDVQVVNGGNGTAKKKTARKKSLSAADVERKRRQTADENFRWNCGVIRGYCSTLKSCQADCERILDDIWTSALSCGMASKASVVESRTPPNGYEHPENLNGNNNTSLATKVNGTRLISFKRSVSNVTRPKTPRSFSQDACPVTLF